MLSFDCVIWIAYYYEQAEIFGFDVSAKSEIIFSHFHLTLGGFVPLLPRIETTNIELGQYKYAL